jgi:hypothetical protein
LEFFVSVISAGMEGVSVGGIGVSIGATVAVFSTTTTTGATVFVGRAGAGSEGGVELVPGKLHASIARIKTRTVNEIFLFIIFSSDGW